MNLEINGEKVWFDYESWKKEQLSLEYRELLMSMVGISATKNMVNAANKYIADHYPKYESFVNV